jgi:hypothetical protein
MMDLDNLIYDYRLGYVRAGTDGGFDILGGDDAPGGRIVTLGGYTTPESARASWVNRLYDRLGGRYQIYNGCTDGYGSAQEMLMCVRDGFLLKPALVLQLSGFYNFAYKLGLVRDKRHASFLRDHPFTTPGQIAFCEKITARFGLGNNEVYYGEENHVPAWEYWLGHVDILNALCAAFGIRYSAFLQPCVFSGGYERSRAEDIALCEIYDLTQAELDAIAFRFRDEYDKAAKAARTRDWLVDLSTLFAGETDVFLNACHARDAYVNRLADAVYGRIGAEEASA